MAGYEDEAVDKTWPLPNAGMASPDTSDCRLNNPIKTKNIFFTENEANWSNLINCIDELIFVAVKIIEKSLQVILD